jgi:hypothetical protein
MGRGTVWADFVLYIVDGQRATPWLLVEVKQRGSRREDAEDAEDAVSQAESYSLVLRAPFFCLTDGREYDFYLTGPSQGRSIALRGRRPPVPRKEEHLPKTLENAWFYSTVDRAVDDFFAGLRKDDVFRRDTQDHENDVRALNKEVFTQLANVEAKKVEGVLDGMSLKTKTPNWNKIRQHIRTDFERFREVLEMIRDMPEDRYEEAETINSLLQRSERGLHIEGAGMFFISQLLAGAHPHRYLVLHANEVRGLRDLGLMDLLVKQDRAEGYLYVCDVCRQLFERKMKDKLAVEGFGLAAVANFLYHYHEYYLRWGMWSKPSAGHRRVRRPSGD